MKRKVCIGEWAFGKDNSLLWIAGPCVIESEAHAMKMADALKVIADRAKLPFIFKASYDKANRTSISSFRGPGPEEGLRILEKIKCEVGVKVLSDIHSEKEVDAAAEVLDVLQAPAFLCRQTDFLTSLGRSGKPVNIKKGQFMAPWDMKNVLDKVLATGNGNIMLTERGACFGYNQLVSDMRSLTIMAEFGFPVIYDATHSVQLPGGQGTASGGERKYVLPLARAAVAVGVDGLFTEVHDQPDKALCDGSNSLPLQQVPQILDQITAIHEKVKAWE